MDEIILRALRVNMDYADGERVAVVAQLPNKSFTNDERVRCEQSLELAERMHEAFVAAGIDSALTSYTPEIARNGADATQDAYDALRERPAEVVFMPTAYSLTHTAFRKEQTDRGARVASMPGFTLEMFEKGGPMDADYAELERETESVAEKLRRSSHVRVTAEGTDVIVELDNDLVISSSGLIHGRGSYGNLPGAEAFVVPKHRGGSNGYITVPKGWGGPTALAHAVKLTIKQGAFVDAEPVDGSEEAQAYIDAHVKPLLFGGEDHEILAELGIGTNTSITAETMERYGWRILLAEKIGGSAHFANGNSKGMGGRNDVPVHIDWVVPSVKIEYLE